ncbi:tudor domain-containing protein 7-like isoform X3 [Ostrea edulis]|uniref:tudor domain-containing protein 7-like isoform X3 n=1 Tax=Ostrea edulis TaxID=37623 RepID=UPI0024AF5A28|nr:tudor domain-containing protein 7-like isoform X3 [Ostrea edulis]
MALEEVKSMLRAVLMSCKEGVPAHVLQGDYQEITQEPLPLKKLGFSNIVDFINSIPDVVRVRRNKQGEIVYHAVANEETAHIQSMVSKQRSIKKTRRLKVSPAMRRPPTKSPLKIQINMSNGNRRRVTVNKAFNAAMTAATSGNYGQSDSGQFGKRFEIPPRFKKLQGGKENVPLESTATSKPSPVSNPPSRAKDVKFEKVVGGEKYLEALVNYHRRNNETSLKFDTFPTKVGKSPGFVSSVIINGTNYGSGDVYGSVEDSEFAAARNAVHSLRILSSSGENTPRTQSPLMSDSDIKERVRELMKGKHNGMWDTRLEFLYKERYQTEPPSSLVFQIKNWPDLIRVEPCSLTGRNRLYPVTEEIKKPGPGHHLTPAKQDPGLPTSTSRQDPGSSPTPVKPVTNISQQNDTPLVDPAKAPVPSVIKEITVCAGDSLTLGEKVTVYMVYLGEDGSFCIQCGDSAIFQITEDIEIVADGPVPDLEDLQPGRFIAALYNAGTESLWSRAEIISREGAMVDVLFIDYGNSATCAQNSTRFLTEELAKYPSQVIYCHLYGVAPLEDEEIWSDSCKKKFEEIVTDEKLIAITKEILSDGTHIVELFLSADPTTSINDRLVTEGLLRVLTAEEEMAPIPSDEPDILELPSENQWDIYVSFLNNSTNSVMIRLVGENYSDKLEELERHLEKSFHNATEEEIMKGMVCVAYVDGLFHRIRVMEKGIRKYQCLFLDHGDTDELIPDQLRILDPKVNKSVPYQAIEVSLDGLESFAENVTTLEKVFDMALGKTFVAEVTARDETLSIVMYNTQGESDINVNQEILKAVLHEAETSLLTASGSNPQSTESSPLPQRKTTELSTKPSGSASPRPVSSSLPPPSEISSNDNSGKKTSKGTNSCGADAWETESGEGSWETEEEEVVIDGVGNSERKSAAPGTQSKAGVGNSERKSAAPGTQSKAAQISSRVKKVTETRSELPTQDNVNPESAPGAAGGDISQNPGTQNLYTWSSAGKPSEGDSNKMYKNDDIALLDINVYNTRPVPEKFKIPPRGEYLDIHVINVFDPTNFACIPFQHMTELDELVKNMMEYFNSVDKMQSLKGPDLMVSQMYAGCKEGAWYRIVIKNVISIDLASVCLADFGEFTVMSVDEIKLLPYCFTKLPALAFKGKLYGIKPAKDSQVWSEAAKYKFLQMAHNHSLVGLVCGEEEEAGQQLVSMRLVDTSVSNRDTCLDEVLLEMGVAEKLRPSS